MRDHGEKLEFNVVGFLSLEPGAGFGGKEAHVIHGDAYLIDKNLDVAVILPAPVLRRTEGPSKQPQTAPGGGQGKKHHPAGCCWLKPGTGRLSPAAPRS